VSAAPIRRGAAVSLIAHTGHYDDSHSPDTWASVSQADQTRLFVDRGGLHRRDLAGAKCLAHDVESA
jgi:hypothetical protein